MIILDIDINYSALTSSINEIKDPITLTITYQNTPLSILNIEVFVI
jgi:hypothetical protein